MQGGSEVTLSIQNTLKYPLVKELWAMPPIDVDFQIQKFTASGSTVRYLKVTEKSNYESAKLVRYLTGAIGSYQVQVSSLILSFGERWIQY